MPLTEEQLRWTAETLGIDLGPYSSAQNGGASTEAEPAASVMEDAAPGSGPPTPGPSPTPAPAQDTAASCWITVTNDTKSVLKLARQGHDVGDFESFPTPTLAPGAATSFVSVQTPGAKPDAQGCRGFVEWTVVPADAKSGTSATWHVTWNNPVGEKNTASATITPSGAGFSSLEQIGQGDAHVPATFTLSQGAGGAAGATPTPRRDAVITIQNASDATLLLTQEVLDRVSTEALIPTTIAAGQTVTLPVSLEEFTSSVLLYGPVAAGVTKAPNSDQRWELKWWIPPGGNIEASADIDHATGLTSEAKTDGTAKISFRLSGKFATAAQAGPVGITIDNDSDQTLHLSTATSDGGRFDPAPPAEIAPGAKATLAARDTGPKGGSLVYQLKPKDGTAGEHAPAWTLSWTHPAGQPLAADADLNPAPRGLTSAAIAGKSSIAYGLSGTMAAAAPDQSPVVEYQTKVTYINNSNMLLRRSGADRQPVTWNPLPPQEIKPGGSFTVTAFSKGEASAGLMYDILPADGSPPKDGKAPWWVVGFHHYSEDGHHGILVNHFIDPKMPGLRSRYSVDKDAVTFELSGQWSAQPRDWKTGVSIANNSTFTLRLTASESSAGRFDPAATNEIAPGAKGSCASWAKVASKQRLVYEVVPAEGTAKGEDKTKPGFWTITWDTEPGESPEYGDVTDDEVPTLRSEGRLEGPDLEDLTFTLHAVAPADKK